MLLCTPSTSPSSSNLCRFISFIIALAFSTVMSSAATTSVWTHWGDLTYCCSGQTILNFKISLYSLSTNVKTLSSHCICHNKHLSLLLLFVSSHWTVFTGQQLQMLVEKWWLPLLASPISVSRPFSLQTFKDAIEGKTQAQLLTAIPYWLIYWYTRNETEPSLV